MGDALRQDVRRAARRLLRTPGFTAIAVVTLALGIGANTAIFSAIHTVLLRPLPFPDPGRVVQLYSTVDGDPATVSPPDFVDWRREERLFVSAAAWFRSPLALSDENGARRIDGVRTTPELFAVMRVPALLGRTLQSSDSIAVAPPVAVLSHAAWQLHFGGDRGILGRSIRLDGVPHEIVGVMPPDLVYPLRTEVWVPLVFDTDDLTTQRGAHYLSVVARLAPGVSFTDAGAGVDAVARRLAIEYPNTNRGYGGAAMPLHEWMVGDVRPVLLMLLGAVGLVLLVACVNVANLLLARSIGREREIAVRLSLGATRWRIVRELVVESLLLGVAGAAAGLLLASWGVDALAALEAADIPRLAGATIDGPVLAFAAALGILSALLFGFLPAVHTSRRHDITTALKDGAAAVLGGRGGWRTRRALVVAEVTLAVLLLAGAGLLLRSFLELQRVEPGFTTVGLLTFEIDLPSRDYDPPERREFARELIARIDALPGAEEVAAVFGLPMSGFNYGISISTLDGRRLEPEEQDRLSVQVRAATPGFFRAMRIRLVRGREFTDADREGAPPVVVVTASAAQQLWPGIDPIGRRVELGTRFGLGGERAGGTVVGVVSDIRDIGPAAEARPLVWVAHAQYPVDYLAVVVRSAGDPASLMAPIRRIVRELDANLPIDEMRPMSSIAAETVAEPRLYTLLIAAFAATATLLSAIGLYGVISQLVLHRRREIGVRMALGARASDVLRMVAGQGMRMVAMGLALGLAASLAATRVLRGLLFGVEPTDALTLAAVSLVLLLAAAAACWIPARRATQLDPAMALRAD